MKKGLFLLSAVLLLTSCLSVDTTIELKRDGSGRLDIVYSIDAEMYGLGVFDESDSALPIPVSRAAFEESADRIPGIRVRRYRNREETGKVIVSARILFDSIDALNRWFGSGEEVIRLTESAETTTWTQLIYPGDGSADQMTPSGALDDYQISFTLKPPAEVISAGAGEVVDGGRSASVAVTLAQIASAQTPLYWEVSW